MMFWKILVVLSAIATLSLIGACWVWCDAKNPAMKRAAERVRHASVLLSAGVYITIVVKLLIE